MNKNSQAILILCGNICVGDNLRPFKPSEWKKLAKQLAKKGITPGALLELSKDEMIEALNCEEEYANRIIDLTGRSASLFFEVSKYENMGISLITRADNDYPQRIKQKLGESCPPYFFCAGDLSLLKKRSIGFVGSRNMLADDIRFETNLVKDAISNKYAIVSGGARGADTISEEVALKNNGRIIEYLSDSMMKKLQKSNIVKAVQSGKLLLLSVVNPDAPFNVGNAMNRNKYIYAQADAVMAIKSINRGGTWSGAIENLKKNYCPVYCWRNEKYEDNLSLISNGAIPIDDTWSIQDISSNDSHSSEYTKEKKAENNQQLSLFSQE